MSFSLTRRAMSVVAGAAAITLITASGANAHHCLKTWQTAQAAAGSTGNAWMPLSDFAAFAALEFLPGATQECADSAEAIAAVYMSMTGAATEPSINTKATVAGGALHQGKSTRTIGEIDFGALVGAFMSVEACDSIDWSQVE